MLARRSRYSATPGSSWQPRVGLNRELTRRLAPWPLAPRSISGFAWQLAIWVIMLLTASTWIGRCSRMRQISSISWSMTCS